MNVRLLLMSPAIALLAAGPLSAEPTAVGWGDLAPSVAVAEVSNPFEAMSPEQLDTLRRLLRLEAGESASEAQASALRAKLAADGLDADALFAQREQIMRQRRRAAEGVNEALVGQDVRLPGYLLPLELSDDKVTEFLLVPTLGACIHTPPPPANQMIHVRYPEGIAVDGLYTPVWIQGTLMAESAVQSVRYVDGQSRVASSYTMQPDLVEPY